MAESFLFNIAERVLEKIALLAADEIRLAFNVKSELQKLKETMSIIKDVLLDAERKQHQNDRLHRYVWKLRDLFYDAEDLIDEFECDALRKKSGNHVSSTTRKVRCLASCSNFPLSFSLTMGHKIKKINQRLDEIVTEWKRFDLGQGGDNRRVIYRETHSFVNSSDVIGRDEDKENIIHLLMKPSEGGNIPVIPIVGIGGLGKTTLAQLVYNDERVNRLFTSKMWVCVSEEFDLPRLLKEIIVSISNVERCDNLSLDALQSRLRSLLNNKNFLLVLDDVWNEDRVKWSRLRDILKSLSNLSQSKIIVTTRTLKVVSVMSSVDPYQLQGLSHGDCLKLFIKWAFNDEDGRQYPNLMTIGEEIVKRCKGVPLAVRTLGSSLFSIVDEQEWIYVRDSEIWRLEQSQEDILPILKLSYHHLPSHLQRCVALLSLYKKDYVYFTSRIIYLWMANGMLECPRKDEEWEDVGRRYLSELESRCFIQDVHDYKDHTISFKVHDLIHDLVSEVSQKECRAMNCQTEDIDEKIRHLSFNDDEPPNFLQNLKKVKNVRTILLRRLPEQSKSTIDISFINFCVKNSKYLRALDLSGSSLKVLPDSIGTLKHLRFLGLNNCRNLQKLPNSLYELQSLLCLEIGGTSLMQLSDSMQRLTKLRRLVISTVATQLMAIQPGSWSSLRFLSLIRCENIECLFEGIQYLKSLRVLVVLHCPKIVSLPRCLKLLTKLEKLLIFSCESINFHMEWEEDEDQHIPLKLKTFEIIKADAVTDLPRLLLEGSSSTLQNLLICRCDNLEALPQWLQNLTSLEKIEIIGCPKISSLPEGMNRLTALQKLKIQRCPILNRRYQRDGGEDWPRIAHIKEVDVEDF